MDFFSQVWIGLCQELSIYKNQPKALLSKALSVIIFITLTIIIGLTSKDSLVSAAVVNAICQFCLYFSPAKTIIDKVSSERASHFKEYLLINGMSKIAYQAKIAVSNYFEILLFAIIQTIALFFSYYKNFTTWTVIFPMFLVLFFGGIATVNMALYLSTLLNPKIAPQLGSVLFLLLGLLYFLPTELIAKLPLYILVSMHPGAGIALGINVLLPADSTGIDWDGYIVLGPIMILVTSSAIFLGLYLYNEREKSTDTKQSKKQKKKLAPLLDDPEQPQNPFGSTIVHEKLTGMTSQIKTIEASCIRKEYPGHTVIDNISFSICEGEVFCLLGHSGAGKSTLVNILTGLIQKTEGSILYNGENVNSDNSRLKDNIGFCPQKDLIMLENTVYENLFFFAGIQGIPSDRKDSEINRVMNRLGLVALKSMPVKKLSSGFKRKLNVAISLLKDPKIIILDEPTSGMDPVSRKNVWSLIKDLKSENKTVLVTTQSLSEAEEVADRIAIITKGKFLAVGTLDFLKKTLGTGYSLVIENSDKGLLKESQKSEISDIVQTIIPSATGNLDTASNALQFTLPVDEQNKFSELFTQLENMPDIHMSLHNVSLEEAFVKLAFNSEKTPAKNHQKIENNQNSVDIPSSFFRDQRPTFKDQLKAIILARLYQMKRNKSALFYMSFPLLFIISGIVIGGHLNDKQVGLVVMITMILFGEAIMIINVARFISAQRKLKIIHTLKAMGVRTLPYWIGNIIADFIWILIMALFVLASIYIFNIQLLKPIIVPFMGLYIGVSYGMIIMAYNLALSFDSMFGIILAGPCFVIGGGILPKMFNDFLRMQFGISIDMYVYIFAFIFLGPGILLQLGLNLMLPQYGESSYLLYAPFKEPWVYGLKAIGMSILHFIRLLYMDYKVFGLQDSKKFTETVDDEVLVTPIEEEVEIEKERISGQENKDVIKALDVAKVYPNGLKALHEVSFGVEQGQICCLVGPKGAGKTTVLEILAGMMAKTAGSIYLDDKELVKKIYEQLYSKNYYDIGICSELNTLWEHVTVEEHLRTYARIKGRRGAEIEEAVQYLIKALQLEEVAQQVSEKLSEGNKRKLCVAIALVGGSKLLFLDKPTTGMNSEARDCVWSVIKGVVEERQGAVVISTDKEEAGLVADKLGILVNGRLSTIHSTSNLKKKSEEYSIVVYKNEGGLSTAEIEELIMSTIPGSRRQNTRLDTRLIFQVPSSLMKFGKVFSELQTVKTLGKITDFSIDNNRLEQIFLQHFKHQKSLIEA